MRKINLIPKMGWDKVNHFFFSGFFFLLANAIFDSMWLSFTIVFILGVVKEIYDYHSDYHVCDIWDVVANTLGIVIAMYVVLI